MFICTLWKWSTREKKDGCWKSFCNNLSKYMLKTLCPEEWPESPLCFLSFEINNKTRFCLVSSPSRGVLPSLKTPEIFFLYLSLAPLNTFGSALDLSSVKIHFQRICDLRVILARPEHHSVLLWLCLTVTWCYSQWREAFLLPMHGSLGSLWAGFWEGSAVYWIMVSSPFCADCWRCMQEAWMLFSSDISKWIS